MTKIEEFGLLTLKKSNYAKLLYVVTLKVTIKFYNLKYIVICSDPSKLLRSFDSDSGTNDVQVMLLVPLLTGFIKYCLIFLEFATFLIKVIGRFSSPKVAIPPKIKSIKGSSIRT